jgi:hypothetical protein
MSEINKAALTNLHTWKRGLFMVLFAIISWLAKWVVNIVALLQFVTLLITGKTNTSVLPFGQNLSTYLYQITLFLTFKTEDMPFPFTSFPDEASEIEQVQSSDEDVVVTKTEAPKEDISVESTDETSSNNDVDNEAKKEL